jgi:hypothetical protein
LVRDEFGIGSIVPERPQQTMLDRDSMEDGLPDPARQPDVDRAAVTQDLGVPHHDEVDRPAGDRSERYRLIRPSISKVGTPAIDRVGPDTVMETLTDEVMHHRQLPGLETRNALLGGVFRVVEPQTRGQGDDEWLARSPGLTQRIGHGGGHRAHLDPLARFP